MSRRAARATQADMHRAIKAVAQSGERMKVVIRSNGDIEIVPLEPEVRLTENGGIERDLIF